jgi:hypothetical protein
MPSEDAGQCKRNCNPELCIVQSTSECGCFISAVHVTHRNEKVEMKHKNSNGPVFVSAVMGLNAVRKNRVCPVQVLSLCPSSSGPAPQKWTVFCTSHVLLP